MPTDPSVEEVASRALTYFQQWRGHRQALSRKDLCSALGCSDRMLRFAVAELRCRGHLIVAVPDGGYRYAVEGAEVYQYVASLTSRIQALREVAEAMKAAAGREFGPAVRQERLL